MGAQELMAAERRTIRNWAARLSAQDEPLTLEEAQLLAAISASDRLLEVRDALQDVQMRLTRMECFLAAAVPGYDQAARRALTGG